MYNALKKKVLPILILLFVSTIVFSACSKVDFKVSFIVDGDVVATVSTNGSETIKMPDDPVKEDSTFDGWFWDKDVWERPFEENSLLDKALEENISVYAKWVVDSNIFTATFVTNGGTSVQDFKGSIIHSSPLTQKDDYNFMGWYTVSSFNESTIAIFPYSLTENTIFYAKWALNSSEALKFSFQADSSSYSITGYTGTESRVIVPDTYNGAPVTEIGVRAFKDNLNIKEIIIPDSVEVIGRDAFYNCSALSSIKIPDDLISIGERAFDGSGVFVNAADNSIVYVDNWAIGYKGNLTDAEIAVGVKGIADYAFYGCGMTSIIIPDSVIHIRDAAFFGCGELTEIVVPDSVTNLGKFAFHSCRSLKSATLGNGVSIIQDSVFYGCESLTSVSLSGSITNIENKAFERCTNLAELFIPYSVESIGNESFQHCSALTNVTIGNSMTRLGRRSSADYSNLTSIGDYAFNSCSSLTDIALPESLKSIGDGAFINCSALMSVKIPRSVTYMGMRVFYGTDLYKDADENGVVYTDNWVVNGKGAREVVLAEGTIGIADYAFSYNRILEKIVIPDSVTIIGAYAFIGCSSLTSIVIPDSVTTIGSYAFSDCSSLTSVVIPDSVTTIGNYAFNRCSSLTNINIGSGLTEFSIDNFYFGSLESIEVSQNNYTYKAIDGVLFNKAGTVLLVYPQAKKGASYAVPDSVTTIGSYAFSDCSSLTSVVIPDSVTTIGNYAFNRCSSLTNINIPDGVTTIGNSTFSGCSSLTSIIIGDSVTTIGNSTFSGCSSLTSVVIPDSVTSIRWNAFYGCRSLTDINIPDSVISIEIYAFYNTAIYNNAANNSVIYLDGWVIGFKGDIVDVVIDEGTKGIAWFAFGGCSSLQTIKIPESLKHIGAGVFSNCSKLKTIDVADNNTAYKSIDDVLFDIAGTTLIQFPGGKAANYTVPESVTSIGFSAFHGCRELVSLVIGSNVTNIGDYAFEDCWSLESVIIGNSVMTIGEGAFNRCYSLRDIVIPDSVEVIEAYAFQDCTILENITIGSGIKSIGERAFQAYGGSAEPKRKSIIIYAKIPPIIAEALVSEGYDNSSLGDLIRSIYAPSASVMAYQTANGWSQYAGVINSQAIIDENDFVIQDGVLIQYLGRETSIIIPNSVTNIGSSAFYGSSLTSILIPDSVTSIGSSAFDISSSLTIYAEAASKPNGWSDYWNYDNRPVYWGITDDNFYETDGLQFVIQDGNAIVARITGTQKNIAIPTVITINGTTYSVVGIGNNAFSNCSLTSIVIPDSVKSIGSSAFSGCNSLTSIVIPNSVTTIGSSALTNCSSLTSILIPDSVTTIGNFAFSNCSSLTIYAEAVIRLDGWSNIWNLDNRPVYLGVTDDNFYETDGLQFVIQDGNAIVARITGTQKNIAIPTVITINGTTYSVVSIGNNAFSNCSSLTSIVISGSVTTIGNYTFSGCSSLTSIVIPDSVTSIGSSAFGGCRSLTSIVIPNSVTSIGGGAFHNCSSLTIYAEAASKPDGWNISWNPINRPIFWEYAGS